MTKEQIIARTKETIQVDVQRMIRLLDNFNDLLSLPTNEGFAETDSVLVELQLGLRFLQLTKHDADLELRRADDNE